MKKIGISCRALIKQYGIERGLEICKESGFDAVDYSIENYKPEDEIYGGSDDAFESHFAAIKEKAASLELEISQTHGRCVTYWPNDPAHNEWVDRVCKLDLRATAALGAPSCVVHFPNNSRWGKQPPELMHEVAAKLYDTLIPSAEQYQVNIAMETFGATKFAGVTSREFFADPTEFMRQFNRLDTKYKTICVDTGHTHEAEIFWVPSPEEIIRIFGKNISILHLHDNHGHYDEHNLPGMGNINWPAVFSALDEVGYSGVYNFELSLFFAGSMLEDFVNFAGKYLRRFVDNNGSTR